jgi:hypothetical protein
LVVVYIQQPFYEKQSKKKRKTKDHTTSIISIEIKIAYRPYSHPTWVLLLMHCIKRYSSTKGRNYRMKYKPTFRHVYGRDHTRELGFKQHTIAKSK